MKKGKAIKKIPVASIAFLFLLFCGLAQIVPAQAPTPQPTPLIVRPSRVGQDQPVGNSANPNSIAGLELRQRILQVLVQPLYRKPTRKELTTVAPDPDLIKKFEAFLAQENTGIFKLIVDAGCAENVNVVTATEKCLKFSMPGAGNSYSFRVQNYRIRRLADLTLWDEKLFVTGILAHGILVDIGDVLLENTTLQTAGTKFLNEFQPAVDLNGARTIDKQLIAGVTKDGFLYRRGLAAVENTTYVLRSIAYNGKVMRAVRGIIYNELEFDKRKDVTVAFRIVRRDPDGSLTLLWKELSVKDSPKIKPNKKVAENKFVAANPVK